MHKNLFFLFALLALCSLAFAAPLSNLVLTRVSSPPPFVGNDLNFQLTYNGGNANQIYWQFDSDGNVTMADNNSYLIDTFADGDYTANPKWDVNVGTWTATGGILKNTTAGAGDINTIMDTNFFQHSKTVWDFNLNAGTVADAATIVNFAAQGTTLNANTEKAYQFIVLTTGQACLRFADGIGNVFTITCTAAGDFTNDTNRSIRITRSLDGNFSLFTGGIYKGSQIDNNFLTPKSFWLEFGGQNDYIYGINVYSDLNRVSPQYKTHTFSASGTKVIQVTAQNPDGNASTSMTLDVTADVTPPIITRFDINALTGFGITGQLHYAVQCTDNASSTLVYNILNNDANQYYSASDLNNALVFDMNNVLNNGTNLVRFKCTDQAGNTATDTNTFSGASATFYFVYADTGVALTNAATEYLAADVNTLKTYSYKLNTYLDMKATNAVSLSYSGIDDDSIQFVIDYTDNPPVSVTIDFDISALDVNSIPVCFSKLFPFRQQIFFSSSVRSIILQNGNTGCYAGMANIESAYQDVFQLTAYTIPMVYDLFLIDDNSTRTFISLIDGSLAFQHNVDLLIINSQTKPEVAVTTDVLTANKYCQVSDCNILSVRYLSVQNNSSVIISILNGTTVLTTHTATSPDANNVAFTWDFTSADVNADYLTLKAEITRADGTTETITQLFTMRGIQGFLDPMMALILSVSLFLFGITLVASRFALGWFGIIIVIAAMAILSAAPDVGYVALMQACMFVVGVFFFLTWKNETVAGI